MVDALNLGRRLRVRSTAYIASETVPFFWPIRTFISHNPLLRPGEHAVRTGGAPRGGTIQGRACSCRAATTSSGSARAKYGRTPSPRKSDDDRRICLPCRASTGLAGCTR